MKTDYLYVYYSLYIISDNKNASFKVWYDELYLINLGFNDNTYLITSNLYTK